MRHEIFYLIQISLSLNGIFKMPLGRCISTRNNDKYFS